MTIEQLPAELEVVTRIQLSISVHVKLVLQQNDRVEI